jgi:branched-chain amino acid transport system permease protein
LEIVISGIQVGTVYAVVAIGFSLIWGAARIIYLTYGSFYMLAAYFSYILSTQLGLKPLLSAPLSFIITTAIGIGTYKFCIERIRGHENIVILVTIALAILFQECVLLMFGSQYRGVPPFISGYLGVFGVRISNQHLLAFGVSLILILGVWIFLTKSKLGIAIRATSQDREAVNLMGASEKRMSIIAVSIGVALAVISSIIVAPIYVVEPGMWGHPLVMALAIVVLGGLGSIKGSFIGAYILGFAETIIVYLFPAGSFIKGAVALAVMIFVLLIRPEGLFGVAFEEERL